MKAKITLVFLLLLAAIPLTGKAQFTYYQRFEGNDTAESNSLIIRIDTTIPGNSWQIGQPHKTVFRSDTAFPNNVIVTDTLNLYPPNDSSVFNFMKSFLIYSPVLAMRWVQKLDYDSLHHDGGYVEFSRNGGPWTNIFTPGSAYNLYGFLQANVDTLPNGQIGFVGKDTTWRDIWVCFYGVGQNDTMSFRYTSVSDSDSVRGDGWMIDELMLRPTIVHTVSKIPTGSYAAVYPQPTAGDLIVEADNSTTQQYLISVKLMDYGGRTLQTYRQHLKRMQLDLSPYPDGIYLLQVESDKGTQTHRVILKK